MKPGWLAGPPSNPHHPLPPVASLSSPLAGALYVAQECAVQVEDTCMSAAARVAESTVFKNNRASGGAGGAIYSHTAFAGRVGCPGYMLDVKGGWEGAGRAPSTV